METITAYEDLARLVTGHFHRGVRTNTMVSPEAVSDTHLTLPTRCSV